MLTMSASCFFELSSTPDVRCSSVLQLETVGPTLFLVHRRIDRVGPSLPRLGSHGPLLPPLHCDDDCSRLHCDLAWSVFQWGRHGENGGWEPDVGLFGPNIYRRDRVTLPPEVRNRSRALHILLPYRVCHSQMPRKVVFTRAPEIHRRLQRGVVVLASFCRSVLNPSPRLAPCLGFDW